MKATMRPARALRALGAAALAALAMTMLAACEQDELGAAAIVDGQVISTDELQSAALDYRAAAPDADQSQAQQRILERIVFSRVIAAAARQADVALSAGTVATQRDQLLERTKGRRALVQALAGQQPPVVLPPSYIDQWIRDQLLFRKIAEASGGDGPATQQDVDTARAALLAASKAMTIKISPRYGSWDPRTGITATISGGLAKTDRELSAGK